MCSRVHATLPRRMYVPIESLEPRQLLSSQVYYGRWTIDATDGADQLIVQPKSGDPNTIQAMLNGVVIEEPRDQIYSLTVNLAAGNDSVIFKPGGWTGTQVYIRAGEGDDTISGSAMADWISGDAGNDVIFGRAGNDTLFGGDGDDVIIGGTGADEISGHVGDDFLAGGAGNDSIHGDSGNDTEVGGGGADFVIGDAGDDSLCGDDGADTLAGGVGSDQLKGGDGNDQIDGSFGNDLIWGGAGSDTLHGGAAADQISGGAAADAIYRQPRLDRIRPDSSDTLFDEQLTVPLTKPDLSTLKNNLIGSATDQWWYELDRKQTNYNSYRYYDRSADGKLFQVDPDTGEPTTTGNTLLSGCSGGGDYSETNVQEEGVDEADLVKTDGKNLYLLDNNRLVIMNAVPAKDAHILSTTDIEGYASGIYLNDKFLTVLSRTDRSLGDCSIYDTPIDTADGKICTTVQSIEQVKVTVFDVSNAAAPLIVEETKLDGSLNTSRIIDGKLYLVLNNRPTVPAPRATFHVEAPLPPDWNGKAEQYGAEPGVPGYVERGDKKYIQQVGSYWEYETEDAYRKRLLAMPLDQLAPSYTSTTPGGKSLTGTLLDPNTVYAGPVSQGYHYWNMTSVVSLDPADHKAGIGSSAAIAGPTGEIYVSRGNLYLAASTYEAPMGDWLGEQRTDLYKFSLSQKGIDLVASGQAPGRVIDSFAMDEQDGRLRIATTSGASNELSNNIFVLQQHGQTLQVDGSLTGLAFTEDIRSARFDGDRGYLVTFFRKDPLFVIDLSDPLNPKVSGKLEIPGYSSYLQPIAGQRVIGIGQNANENGWETGLQVSLFDISDPKNPIRSANFLFQTDESFDWSESIAQSDHHAFAFFPQQGILALPVSTWNVNGYESTAYILRIGKSDITLIGKVAENGSATRNVRIGENLYAISSKEVKIVQLSNPQNQLATVALPPSPDDDAYYSV